MELGLPLYNISVDDNDELGVYKMSFVEYPAVEVNWLAFEKAEKQQLFFADEEKHIVTSVALRANFPIYRVGQMGEYYVVFNRETINKIVERFFKNGNNNKVNLEHDKDVDGCYLIESYFASENNAFGVSEGSWICSYKVDNPEVWAKIKSGEFNGFSVEGYFDQEMMLSKTEKAPVDELDEYITNLLK